MLLVCLFSVWFCFWMDLFAQMAAKIAQLETELEETEARAESAEE